MTGLPDQEISATAALIARHPLAWVVSRRFDASVLPLLGEYDGDGQLVAVIGHCSRGNPLIDAFARDPAGLILFNGPAGYISTEFVTNKNWAPTWNFAVLRLEVEVECLPERTGEFVDRLLDHMEGEARWTIGHLGDRYETLLSRIVGFRAHVRAARPQFKLGQDEAAATFREIVERLPGADLAAWMEAFARGETP